MPDYEAGGHLTRALLSESERKMLHISEAILAKQELNDLITSVRNKIATTIDSLCCHEDQSQRFAAELLRQADEQMQRIQALARGL